MVANAYRVSELTTSATLKIRCSKRQSTFNKTASIKLLWSRQLATITNVQYRRCNNQISTCHRTFLLLIITPFTMLPQRYVPLLIGLVRNIVALPTSTSTTSSGVVCSTTFSPISASAWVEGVSPGWNLGNTLDATPDETSWGMPKASTETFQTVKDAGFTGIRLPGEYRAYHEIARTSLHAPRYTSNNFR